jgi:hypothetical protein
MTDIVKCIDGVVNIYLNMVKNTVQITGIMAALWIQGGSFLQKMTQHYSS